MQFILSKNLCLKTGGLRKLTLCSGLIFRKTSLENVGKFDFDFCHSRLLFFRLE